MVRAPDCRSGGCGFDSRPRRFFRSRSVNFLSATLTGGLVLVAILCDETCLNALKVAVQQLLVSWGILPRWGRWRRVRRKKKPKTRCFQVFLTSGTRCALPTEHVSNATCVTLFSMSSVGRGSCPENQDILSVSHRIRHRTRFASDPQKFAEVGANALQRDGKPGRSQLGLHPW